MIRKLLCPSCGLDYKPHPDDTADGWQIRKKEIVAKKPAEHNIEVHAGFEKTIIPVPFLVCDFCNGKIEDGSKAVAVTSWRGEEPGDWEQEYSTP